MPTIDQASGALPEALKVPVGSLVFDVTTAGPPDGPPVLLLHGFPQTSWSWRHVIRALAQAGYRAIAVDQRGYSAQASPESVDEYAGHHLVKDVIGLLDALDIPSVHLVGHDWGAAVAWQIAGHYPQRVRTLSALSVPHPAAFAEALTTDADQQARSAYMADFARPGHEEVLLANGASNLRALFGDGTGVDVEHVLSRVGTGPELRRALNWYSAQSLQGAARTPLTQVPTLHIWSDADWALGEYGARATERFVSGPYRFEVLRGISHWIPEHAPDATAELVMEHIERYS